MLLWGIQDLLNVLQMFYPSDLKMIKACILENICKFYLSVLMQKDQFANTIFIEITHSRCILSAANNNEQKTQHNK